MFLLLFIFGTIILIVISWKTGFKVIDNYQLELQIDQLA